MQLFFSLSYCWHNAAVNCFEFIHAFFGGRHNNLNLINISISMFLQPFTASRVYLAFVVYFSTINCFLLFRVIDGLDVVDELEKLPVNPKNYKPTSETRINSVTIHANPLAG